ncbi:hypothetical protein F7725_002199 [Dissostichus mawsoni]|uniref:Sciellin n=1 Tax=Dissostichus mawsoni TaxID=36200 RepID=A0A7J5Y205_DISMA|nr:hypothetical protein F7725_002199 [Dissostichus mawsoni]
MSAYSAYKTPSLLKDNSWIRKVDDEDEAVDRDPNFGKTVLSQVKTDETSVGSRTSSVSKDGTTTETTFTTTQSLKSPVLKSPTMTETFSERVKNTSKGAEDKLFDTLIPSKIKDINSPTDSRKTVSTVETVTVRSSADTDAEDNLFDTLVPSKIKDDYSSSDSKRTISSTEYVTVRSSSNGAEDDLYGTLLPKSITNASSLSSSASYSSYTDDLPSTRTSSYTISSTPSDDYSSDKTFSYSKPNSSYENTSISSPTSYSSKTYRSSRTVLEKDLCSYCRKPFTGDAKMVLDDMKINCHATCFKKNGVAEFSPKPSLEMKHL